MEDGQFVWYNDLKWKLANQAGSSLEEPEFAVTLLCGSEKDDRRIETIEFESQEQLQALIGELENAV